MALSMSPSELEQQLNELKSDSAKRRWATIGRLVNANVTDERFLSVLEHMAVNDPMPYVREEAQAALNYPLIQETLQTRKQKAARLAQEQANKPNTPPLPPARKPPPPPARRMPSSIQPFELTTDSPPSPTPTPTTAASDATACAHCGFANPSGMKFCQNCGKSLVVAAGVCSQCGTQNPSSSKFCGNCGAALAQQENPTQSPGVQTRTDSISPALREAQSHRGDRKDPKQMTVRYQLQKIQPIEDVIRVASLLEFDQNGSVTNYDQLVWETNTVGVNTVRLGNRMVSLSADQHQMLNQIIQELNPDGLVQAFVEDSLTEALKIIKERKNFIVANMLLYGKPEPAEGAPVAVYSPIGMSLQAQNQDAQNQESRFAFLYPILADVLLAFLNGQDAYTLFAEAVKSGDKFEIEFFLEGQPIPSKSKCVSCGREIFQGNSICYQCGAPQNAQVVQLMGVPQGQAYSQGGYAPPQPERWEFCEIFWEGKKSGAKGVFNVAMKTAFTGNPFGSSYSHIQFWVKASSPMGDYNAGESEWLSAPGYPDHRNRNHAKALEQLVSTLLQQGWEPMGQGENWFNIRLRRRFRG